MAELLHQQDQWLQIRKDLPAVPLIIAGDLNQSLDGSRWYGSQPTRHALLQAFGAAGLECLTLEDAVTAGKLKANHLVDHICATSGLAAEGGIQCWEPYSKQGLRLSDHPGVAAQLVRQGRSWLHWTGVK